jgi:hypothetical protein
MGKIDRSYFIQRVSEELAAAEKATSPKAARIHSELALRYSAMAEEQHSTTRAEVLLSRSRLNP